MDALLKTKLTRTHLGEPVTTTHDQSFFWKNLESNRFAIIPTLLVLIGCMGALSASFGAEGSVTKLVIVAFPISIVTSLIIGLAPMKIVFYVSILAIVDLIYLIFQKKQPEKTKSSSINWQHTLNK